MAKASPPQSSSTSQITSTSSTNEYDVTATTAKAAAAGPSPSTEDPRDECVLCCYPLPNENESVYHECCGELI